MAFTQFTKDMEIIGKLSDTPNVDDGMTADQLKAKFDEAGESIKEYINNTLLPECEAPITADRIATGAVTGTKIADGAVTVSKIATGAIVSSRINDGSVITAKISDGAVTTEKFASDAVAPFATKATQLATSRNITVKDSTGTYSGTAAGFNGTAAITLKMPATGRFDTLILGSGSYGSTLPAAGTAGRVFFKKV